MQALNKLSVAHHRDRFFSKKSLALARMVFQTAENDWVRKPQLTLSHCRLYILRLCSLDRKMPPSDQAKNLQLCVATAVQLPSSPPPF